MPNVIKMPTPVPRDSQELPSLPNYAGHFLCLNPEKVRTFQCGGFILGPRRLSAVVPDDAQMIRIHRALDEGVLLDITQSGEIRTENFALQSPVENDTAKKAKAKLVIETNTIFGGLHVREKAKTADF